MQGEDPYRIHRDTKKHNQTKSQRLFRELGELRLHLATTRNPLSTKRAPAKIALHYSKKIALRFVALRFRGATASIPAELHERVKYVADVLVCLRRTLQEGNVPLLGFLLGKVLRNLPFILEIGFIADENHRHVLTRGKDIITGQRGASS